MAYYCMLAINLLYLTIKFWVDNFNFIELEILKIKCIVRTIGTYKL